MKQGPVEPHLVIFRTKKRIALGLEGGCCLVVVVVDTKPEERPGGDLSGPLRQGLRNNVNGQPPFNTRTRDASHTVTAELLLVLSLIEMLTVFAVRISHG